MSISEWTTFIGVFLSITLLITGLLQYSKAQRWKRAEFVAVELKDFESKPKVRNVMRMLDYSKRRLELFPERDHEDRWCIVSNDTLCDALVYHEERTKFFPAEVAIRDSFDEFFDGLERVHSFLQSRLVTKKGLEPYLKYWLDVLGDPKNDRLSQEARNQIRSYVQSYGYLGVEDLIDRFELPGKENRFRRLKSFGRHQQQRDPLAVKAVSNTLSDERKSLLQKMKGEAPTG